MVGVGSWADVPAWCWQLLGAACGLAAGVGLGAIRFREKREEERKLGRDQVFIPAAVPTPAAQPSTTPTPLPPARSQRALEATVVLPPLSAQNIAAHVPPTQAPTRTPAPQQGQPATAPASAEQATLMEQLERLRESNAELAARLRAASDLHARDMMARSAEQQAEAQRHERRLEEARQNHATELSHLMATMLDQVDSMQREQAARVHALEAEVERLKRLAHLPSDSTSGSATELVTITSGGDMQSPNKRR